MNEGFSYKGEEIDGFFVSEKQKKLWAVELETFARFKEICEKHNLTYWAEGGTLLGAARHRGFIPWDDDIDLLMPYEDYLAFIEAAKEELEEPYFLQSYDTDRGYWPRYIRIRRSDTTGYTENDSHYPGWNKGIFIDIFPCFNISGSKAGYFAQRVLVFLATLPLYGRDAFFRKNIAVNAKLIARILCVPLFLILRIFMSGEAMCRMFLKACAMCKDSGSERIGIVSFKPGDPRWVWPRRLFEKTQSLAFCNTDIAVPAGYDERLKIQYGDWRVCRRIAGIHDGLTYDPDIPYTEFKSTDT